MPSMPVLPRPSCFAGCRRMPSIPCYRAGICRHAGLDKSTVGRQAGGHSGAPEDVNLGRKFTNYFNDWYFVVVSPLPLKHKTNFIIPLPSVSRWLQCCNDLRHPAPLKGRDFSTKKSKVKFSAVVEVEDVEPVEAVPCCALGARAVQKNAVAYIVV